MALEPGARLGPYEIAALLGKGGMGEVYRARDSRLGRDVALKGLPEGFNGDPERRARFEREARVLATLNHPHIGAIHAIEEGAGHPWLVLEFIEGESLAARLDRGPLGLGEALEIAKQVALAIEAAHESGVVHRDLKPGNVMLRPDGTVKVVDFGLATSGPPPGSGSDPRFSLSPTLTYSTGGVLGTAAYMSPEQARGRPVDRRTDIWAFGCVVFECLSGRPAFEGETASDVIARVLEREPDAALLPAAVPATIRRLIERCLEKDATRRLRDIGDARLEIEEVLARRTSSGRITPAPEPAHRAFALRAVLAVALAAALLGGIAGVVLAPRFVPSRGDLALARVALVAPPNLDIGRIVLSPDGSHVVMFGRERVPPGEKQPPFRAWARRLDERDAHPLPGTEGIGTFQFLPDGSALEFPSPPGAGTPRLWKVALDGSAPAVAIADWNPSWVGLMVLDGGDALALTGLGAGFVRIPADGRPPGPARTIEGAPPRTRFGFSGHLAGGRVLLNQISYGPRGWSYGVAALDPATARVKVLVEDGGNAVFWRDGQLLFARGDALLAAPFDPTRCEVTGPPVGITSGLRTAFEFIPGEFQLTADGTLLCPPGGRTREQSELGFVDHGKFTPWTSEGHAVDGFPTFSRDGHRLLVSVANPRGLDEVWIGSLDEARLDRLISADADCSTPTWAPDGSRFAYSRNGRDSLDGIWVHEFSGASRDRRLYGPDSLTNTRPSSWSPDGRWLLLTRFTGGHPEILRLEVPPPGGVPAPPRAIFDPPINAQQPTFSPDGRWIAFASLETGRGEIALCAFRPDGTVSPPIRVTRDGGFFPQWGTRGARLYYGAANDRVERVNVLPGPVPTFSKAEPVVEFGTLGVGNWSLAPGERVMVARVRDPGAATTHVDLALHWDRELERRLAATRTAR
jgi:hypothetical protein